MALTPVPVTGCATVTGPWEYQPAGTDEWHPIIVPGEPAMQGFTVTPGVPARYRCLVALASTDANGTSTAHAASAASDTALPDAGRHLLQFTGTYSDATVYIDGALAGSHRGGFSTWQIDITRQVHKAATVEVVVEITDNPDDLSFASRYAKHPIGGILGPVELVSLPERHIASWHHETYADDADTPSGLDLTIEVAAPTGTGTATGTGTGTATGTEQLALRASLTDPTGKTSTYVHPASAVVHWRIGVPDPITWDADHPRLYTLRLELLDGAQVLETLERRVGLRTVRVVGNQLLVNGSPVHLRGVNRHNIHPDLGRTSTPELDWEDAELFKAANVNFVRTSHYPPHPSFLDACDELGIYVENEAAACFMGTHGGRLHQFDENRLPEFVQAAEEMIERDRDHASVIIWSLGNESIWGPGYAAELDRVREIDPNRAVVFSYPRFRTTDGWAEQRHIVHTDIHSVHYAGWQEVELEPYGLSAQPVLHDEYAHVPCYDVDEFVPDPAVRLAWGESFLHLTDQLRRTDGALGCAIWSGIDEVFELPTGTTGFGQWGIIDIHRRLKPEYWLVTKAFSPVELLTSHAMVDGARLNIPIKSWFDHADLSETEAEYRVVPAAAGDRATDSAGIRYESRRLALPAAPPRGRATLALDLAGARPQDTIDLVLRFGGRVIDHHTIRLSEVGRAGSVLTPLTVRPKILTGAGPDIASATAYEPPALRWVATGLEIDTATGTVYVPSNAGRIARITSAGHDVVIGSPYLHTAPDTGVGGWVHGRINIGMLPDDVEVTGNSIRIVTRGWHGATVVTYTTTVAADGWITVTAELGSNLPNIPRTTTEAGIGLRQAGIAVPLNESLCTFDWRRRSPISWYPDGHLGRLSGSVTTDCAIGVGGRRGDKHTTRWEDQTYEPGMQLVDYEQPRHTRDFRAMRTGVEHAVLRGPAGTWELVADGNQAVQALGQPGAMLAVVATAWAYPEMSWGNRPFPAVTPALGWRATIRFRVRS